MIFSMIGVPIPWPNAATIPVEFLEARGQAFDGGVYPDLALAYPTLILPDLRASFIRGLDNGLGLEVGRVILTKVANKILEHKHTQGGGGRSTVYGYNGSYASYSPVAGGNRYLPYMSQAKTIGSPTNGAVVIGGTENRPINTAYIYIIKAL